MGWCIDTIGRGFADRLHAHSCKPHGGDVQFLYREVTLQIISATFNDKCAEIIGPTLKGARLGLIKCSVNSLRQKFYFKRETSDFLTKMITAFVLLLVKIVYLLDLLWLAVYILPLAIPLTRSTESGR